jgi:hypothetical protein
VIRKFFFIKILVLLPLLIEISGCSDSGQKRPFGVLRLGKIEDFNQAQTFFEVERILLRLDERGWSAMSTLSPLDLSPLIIVKKGTSLLFQSEDQNLEFDSLGVLIKGEPKALYLPFYLLDRGVSGDNGVGGPVDSLYVRVGKEVSSNWRLPIS